MSPLKRFLRWVPCTLGTFLLMVIVALVLDIALQNVMCWPEPLVAVATAVFTVVWSVLSAPRAGIQVGAVWLVIGAALSRYFPNLTSYPECHQMAYQAVGWAWPLTVVCGILALFVLWRLYPR